MKKYKKPTVQMFGYKLSIDSYCESSVESKEEYDEWYSSYSNNFNFIKKVDVDKREFPDIVSSLNIQPGEECFVVWAEWSSGDSFGNAERGQTEGFAIFKNLEAAEKFKEKLYNANDADCKLMKCLDGQIYKFNGLPWLSYFENLNSIYVSKAIMN